MEPKTLHPRARLAVADYKWQRFALDLADSPTPVELADVFQPAFWQQAANKLGEGDTVRIRGQGGEFDIEIVVVSKAPGGLIVEPFPRPTPGSPEWASLMQGIGAIQQLTKEELAKEIGPIELPVTKKKTAVPA